MAVERQQLIGYLAAAGTVAIWTGFILISRLGGKSALTPYDILALRMGTASLLLLPFSLRLPAGSWRNPRLWSLAMLGGLLYGLLVYAGFKQAPAAHGAILLPGMQPFLIAAVAFILNGQKTSRLRLIGLACIALGVASAAVPLLGVASAAVPLLGGQWSPALLLGDGLIFTASIVWAVYSVLARRWSFDPWTLTRFVAFATTLIYLPVYLLWLPKQLAAVPMSTLIVQGLYQGIGPTIVAMLLFLKAVSILGAERTGAMIALVPVLAGVAAAPLLDEPLTVWLLAGLFCVSLGAYLAARPITPTPRSAPCPT